jgi:hypothetical protein
MKQFIDTVKAVRHSNAVAAGTSTITPSAGIDTKGFRRAVFLVEVGAIVSGGVQSVKIQQSDDDGSSDAYSDLEGTSLSITDAQGSKVAIVEVLEPAKRYLKCIMSRATQNSTLEGITVLLTGADIEPVTQPASVLGSEFHQTPAEGTA